MDNLFFVVQMIHIPDPPHGMNPIPLGGSGICIICTAKKPVIQKKPKKNTVIRIRISVWGLRQKIHRFRLTRVFGPASPPCHTPLPLNDAYRLRMRTSPSDHVIDLPLASRSAPPNAKPNHAPSARHSGHFGPQMANNQPRVFFKVETSLHGLTTE